MFGLSNKLCYFCIHYNGWQYGKWLITGYEPIKLHYRWSEIKRFKYHRNSHLLYCVLATGGYTNVD